MVPNTTRQLSKFNPQPGEHFLCEEGNGDFIQGAIYVIDNSGNITDRDGTLWGGFDADIPTYPEAPRFSRWLPEEDAFQLPLFEDMPEKTIEEEFEDDDILAEAQAAGIPSNYYTPDEGPQPDGFTVAMESVVKLPSHYTQYEIEPITFIMKNGFDFWRGNIIKYAARAGSKLYEGMDATESEITDLEKVRRYAEMRINQLKGGEVL